MQKIKEIAKHFIDYTIEGEYKVYRLRHTPFRVRHRYTKYFHRTLEPLKIIPDKIIFDNYMGKSFGCNGKAVTLELLRSGHPYDIVWTVKDAPKHSGEFPKGVRLVEYGSKEAYREFATAGIWALNYQMVHYYNQGLMKKKGQSYIQMWHGSFGIKKIEGDCGNLTDSASWTALAKRNSEDTDYWISNSDFETEVYRHAFWDVRNVCVFGHPRNDIFFTADLKIFYQKICGEYHVEGKRLILYVPTFRDEGMLWDEEMDYERLLAALGRRFGGEWVLLLRLHPRMQEYAKELIPAGDNIRDVTGYSDIQELLAAANAVVTDYSSAIYDFLLTGRPGFIYAPDYQAYEKMRGLYYPLEETPFPVAGDNDTLMENIASFDEKAYGKNAEAFLREKGSGEEGKAARKVAELIGSLVREGKRGTNT